MWLYIYKSTLSDFLFTPLKTNHISLHKAHIFGQQKWIMDYRIPSMIFQIQKTVYLMQIHRTPTKLKSVYDRRNFAFDDSFLLLFLH